MKAYSILLFDLDGTLIDPERAICGSAQYALEKLGRPVPSLRELRPLIGPPLLEGFQEVCGLNLEEAEQAVRYHRERFAREGIGENDPYPGVEELLCRLRDAGKKLGIATSKPEPFAREILQRLGLEPYFHDICGAELKLHGRRTKAAVLEEALRRFGVSDRSQVLLIGDRCYDVEGAAQVGLDALGVLYGYGSAEELRDAVALAASVEELGKLLLEEAGA